MESPMVGVCGGGGGGGRPVLFPEHNFVISGRIDLQLGSCVCCNNKECNVRES